MPSYSVLVVRPNDCPALKATLSGLPVQVLPFSQCKCALEACLRSKPDLLFLNLGSVDACEAVEFVVDVRSIYHQLPIIMSVSHSSEELAVAALNAGVTRYLRPPVTEEVLARVVDEFLPTIEPAQACQLVGAGKLVGHGAATCALRSMIARASRCNSNVLITGETGTGKEVVAEMIHENSSRRQKPFVCLNSTAIPDSLLESELFGYERGAFTGANARRQGKLALANTGTVFFDEIGDLGLNIQAKLLRAIDGKPVYRLGGDQEVPLDVRILAATNQDLESAVEFDRFRKDLYYRLNVVRIQIPPLRERREDIPALLEHYIGHFNIRFGAQVECFSRTAVAQLVSYGWPGNIRELKNVVEVVFVNQPARCVDVQDLPPSIANYLAARTTTSERDAILGALAATNWNKTKAAEQLSWSRMTLYRKMASHKVQTRIPAQGTTTDQFKLFSRKTGT